MSKLPIVFEASNAPTNKIFPDVDASATKACVIVWLVTELPDAGNSTLAALAAVTVPPDVDIVHPLDVPLTCCLA